MLEGYGELMTIDDLANALMVGRNYAYKLCREKSIKAFQLGNKWRIPRVAVEEYIYKKSHLTSPFIERKPFVEC